MISTSIEFICFGELLDVSATNHAKVFLNQIELSILTGRTSKSSQITVLRKMGIVYFVNASGYPVVPRSSIENQPSPPPPQRWMPNLLKGN
jgi:hypothetical protein